MDASHDFMGNVLGGAIRMEGMNQNDDQGQIRWYIEHRIEYLQIKQDTLRNYLKTGEQFDYDILKQFMENKGRLYELQNILNHLTNWQE